MKVGILTVSDSCYAGTAVDRSGENLKLLVETGNLINGSFVTKDILPDEFEQIKAKLLHWSDHLKLDLILTTGGTGFSVRDVTPEATKAVLDKEAVGMVVAMLKGSLDITPLAMLTRLACGTRGKTLIINLPGSMKASAECFQLVAAGIPHAVDLLRGHKPEVEKTHTDLQAEGIKTVYGSHHQLHFQHAPAEMAGTGPSGKSPKYVSTAYGNPSCPWAGQSQFMMTADLSHTSVETDRSRTGTLTVTSPSNNSISEIPLNLPVTMMPASVQFWNSLLSMSETAQTDLIDSVVAVSTSSQTVATTTATTSVFSSSLEPSSMPPMISVSTSDACSRRPLDFPLYSAAAPMYSDKHSHSSTDVSADLPYKEFSVLHSKVTSNHHLCTSQNHASSTFPCDHVVRPQHISSQAYSNTHSGLCAISTAHSSLQTLSFLNSLYTQSQTTPVETVCGVPKTSVGLDTIAFQKADKLQHLTWITPHNDGFKNSGSSSVPLKTTVRCNTSDMDCHSSTICSDQDDICSVTILSDSQPLSCSVYNSEDKDVALDPPHSHVIMNIHQKIPPAVAIDRPSAKVLSEAVADKCDSVITKKIKPAFECAHNSMVQIFLPCSIHTHGQVVQNSHSYPITDLQNNLKSLTNRERTKVLTITKGENKVHSKKVAPAKQVIVNPSSTEHCSPQSRSEASEDLDVCVYNDVDDIDEEEKEDKIGLHHTDLFYEGCELLKDNLEMKADAVNVKTTGPGDCFCDENGEEFTDVSYSKISGKMVNVDFAMSSQTSQNQDSMSSPVRGINQHHKGTASITQCKNIMSTSDNETRKSTEIYPSLWLQDTQSSLSKPLSSSSSSLKWSTTPATGVTAIKTAKIHNVKQQGELLYVPVGEPFKAFIREHPLIQGIYLHKGKREIKKQLAQLCHQCDVSDKMTTWRRGKEILERNCFDDYFELTEEGKREQKDVHLSRKRDQYVVNWYVWCPGHGNCRRRCGGFGVCLAGCQGMQHKQDRHNCSLMINMKLFLSDLTSWRVNITGAHVPPDSGVLWNPPVTSCKQSNRSAKDHNCVIKIAKCKRRCSPKKGVVKTENSDGPVVAAVPVEAWALMESETVTLQGACSVHPKVEDDLKNDAPQSSTNIPTKKRISKMLSNLKRRREERLTTNRTSSLNTKRLSSPSDMGERESHDCNTSNSNSLQNIDKSNDNSMLKNSDNIKESMSCIQHESTLNLCKSIDYYNASHYTAGSSEIDLSSLQGHQLPTELLHLLTSNLSSDTSFNPVINMSCGSDLTDHNWTLPLAYVKDQEKSVVTVGSSRTSGIQNAQGSSEGNIQGASSVFVHSSPDDSCNFSILSSSDIEQCDMLDLQPLDESQNQKEDENTALENLHTVPTMNLSVEFEQPFLSANTLGEILQQANPDGHYSFLDQTSLPGASTDTDMMFLSSFSHLAYSNHSNQTGPSHFLSEHSSNSDVISSLVSFRSNPFTNKSAILQHLQSAKTAASSQELHVPITSTLPQDLLVGLNTSWSPQPMSSSFLTSSGTVTSNIDFPHASMDNSLTSSIPTASKKFPQTSTNKNTSNDISSCYETVCDQLQEVNMGGMSSEPLPSYEEATVALSEQLELNH